MCSRMKADGQREVDSMKQRAIAQVQDDNCRPIGSTY